MPSSVVLRPIYQEPVSPFPSLRGAVLPYLFEGTATKSLGSLEPTGRDVSTNPQFYMLTFVHRPPRKCCRMYAKP